MAKPRLAADWSALTSDVVSRIADVFLTTSDIDYYIALRAVCRNWRIATDDPRGSDRRFRPRGWIFLGGNNGSGDHLFLNVDTGRFLRKDLPKQYNYIPTTDGLLVLDVMASRSGLKICLFNPFTGHRVLYPLNLMGMRRFDKGVTVAGSSPVMLYLWGGQSAACLDATCGFEWVTLFSAEPALESFASVVAYQGRPYAADQRGAVAVVEDHSGREPRLDPVVAANWGQRRPTFLVECAGELMLVRPPTIEGHGEVLEVCWVVVEDKELWSLNGIIRNYAIFLGDRSISVDADKFPGVEGNCIYYIGGGARPQERGICMHRLDDGKDEKLFDDEVDQLKVQARPWTLAQLLMNYAHYQVR